MTFRLTYEIAHDQHAHGQAARVIRIEMECEPAAATKVQEAVSAFLTAITGERGALRRDTQQSAGDVGA